MRLYVGKGPTGGKLLVWARNRKKARMATPKGTKLARVDALSVDFLPSGFTFQTVTMMKSAAPPPAAPDAVSATVEADEHGGDAQGSEHDGQEGQSGRAHE